MQNLPAISAGVHCQAAAGAGDGGGGIQDQQAIPTEAIGHHWRIGQGSIGTIFQA